MAIGHSQLKRAPNRHFQPEMIVQAFKLRTVATSAEVTVATNGGHATGHGKVTAITRPRTDCSIPTGRIKQIRQPRYPALKGYWSG
jgi:hypothetical protein